MKPKILYIYPKHLLNEKYFKRLANKHIKGKFIFIEEKNIKKIIHEIKNSHALINSPKKFFNDKILKLAKKLEWIHTGRAGVDEMIFEKFANSKITFTCGKIIQGPGLADHAVSLLLYFTRNLGFYANQKKKIYSRPLELKNKKCGIIGLGGAGLCLAERLKAFGMQIIGYSDELPPILNSVDNFIDVTKIRKNLGDLDVVICAAALTKTSHNFIDYDFFKKMKKDSIFINISRGKIVKTEDLIKKKIFKKFKGIGLDVTHPEPLPKNNILSKSENILITQHSAGLSDANRKRSIELVDLNLNRFLTRRSLLNVVDKKKGY